MAKKPRAKVKVTGRVRIRRAGSDVWEEVPVKKVTPGRGLLARAKGLFRKRR